MTLLDQAYLDGARIIESETDFSTTGTFTAPTSETLDVIGLYTDDWSQIDLTTGVEFSGQNASFAVRKKTIDDAVEDATIPGYPGRNWQFDTIIQEQPRALFVSETYPDWKLGIIVYKLKERN